MVRVHLMARRNWLDLPTELMFMILQKLDAIHDLISVQHVCSSWRKISKDPLLWRVFNLLSVHNLFGMTPGFEMICKQAVDRSCGQLLSISLSNSVPDHFLQYITRSSTQLRSLRISNCHGFSEEALIEAVSNLPLLEELEIAMLLFTLNVETLRTAGQCCPLLKSLKLSRPFTSKRRRIVRDEDADAIAETMPKLQHLQIFGNTLTNSGLLAILDGCPDLESLDVRCCYNLRLAEGELRRICAERIKVVQLPPDHPPFLGYSIYMDCDSDDDDFRSSSFKFRFMTGDEAELYGYWRYEDAHDYDYLMRDH